MSIKKLLHKPNLIFQGATALTNQLFTMSRLPPAAASITSFSIEELRSTAVPLGIPQHPMHFLMHLHLDTSPRVFFLIFTLSYEEGKDFS